MSALLQQLDIFELRPLITNLNCKLSTVTQYDVRKQLLCLVSDDNDIVLRYINDIGQEVLKLISWFRRTSRFVHDVSFDPTGTWLLVLCFDNTLHIVPALAVVDKTYAEPANSIFPQQPFSHKQVTSYIIPFVGPHECPNSKKCPNHVTDEINADIAAAAGIAAPAADDLQPNQLDNRPIEEGNGGAEAAPTMDAFSHDVPDKMLKAPPNQSDDRTTLGNAFMASNTCPYPLSVVWWQTSEGMQRAIIGYSDGSICFVGLSPNCPFVASTTISSGSVVKLLICKDSTFESVMLLITSSVKLQYKLLLEQKTIKYVYPGDISPSTSQARENDWQIVMPMKTQQTTSIASDSASDHSQIDDEVFVQKSDEDTRKNTNCQRYPTVSQGANNNCTTPVSTFNNNQQQQQQTPPPPPPPTYAQAISRHSEIITKINEMAITTTTSTSNDTTTVTLTTASTKALTSNTSTLATTSTVATLPPPTTTINNFLNTPTTTTTTTIASVTTTTNSSSSFITESTNEIDDYLGRAGLLPAARARLASLKSLGSKKLNALKLRLSDHRQKLSDERKYINK